MTPLKGFDVMALRKPLNFSPAAFCNPDCVEMEGAAIAHACWLNRIPFVVIRAISDSADEEANMSYEQFVLLAAKRSSDLVEKMLEKV